MRESFGIFLLDEAEIILRIYEVDSHEWKLLHYFRHDLGDEKPEAAITVYDLTEIIVDFLAKNTNKNVVDWKFCSRGIADEKINAIIEATGFNIERLTKAREQELISKGMFTELW